MNCHRAECAQPITRCPSKHATGSCWYFNCLGFVHTATLAHSCADCGGDAAPEPAPLPAVEAPAGKPEGEVA